MFVRRHAGGLQRLTPGYSALCGRRDQRHRRTCVQSDSRVLELSSTMQIMRLMLPALPAYYSPGPSRAGRAVARFASGWLCSSSRHGMTALEMANCCQTCTYSHTSCSFCGADAGFRIVRIDWSDLGRALTNKEEHPKLSIRYVLARRTHRVGSMPTNSGRPRQLRVLGSTPSTTLRQRSLWPLHMAYKSASTGSCCCCADTFECISTRLGSP
jgi:hypothetical protein